MLGGGDDIGGGDIGEGEREIEKATVGLNKVGSNSTAELEAAGGDGGGGGNGTHMPPTSVMTRLILIMVWRKLIRNPNTYSSLIGLIWALVAYRSVSQSVQSFSYIPILWINTIIIKGKNIIIYVHGIIVMGLIIMSMGYFGSRWHVAMPKILQQSISILSDAGLGMAMFSLGNTTNLASCKASLVLMMI